ncbi:MAG TPA: prepilin-type N-terminal cleavage/methylation domain-containing protein [Verrucomicrobiae bacterium]|nr:prepilin-type N-terminal cleavage/methylation domain-containing protein [Verrucomicrobiae bacterium]
MRRQSAAFTLLELMVAIGVFALIMIGVIACWKCIIRGTEVAELSAAACQRARIGMKTIETALSVAEMSRANLRYYAFLNDTSGKFASLSFAGRMPNTFPGAGYYGDEVMRRVTFDVEAGADGVKNLMLTQTPLLAAGFEKESPYQIVLARDVSLFTLEFWSIKDGDWEESYDLTNQLPALIRVTLGVGRAGENPDTPFALITREVAPPAVTY